MSLENELKISIAPENLPGKKQEAFRYIGLKELPLEKFNFEASQRPTDLSPHPDFKSWILFRAGKKTPETMSVPATVVLSETDDTVADKLFGDPMATLALARAPALRKIFFKKNFLPESPLYCRNFLDRDVSFFPQAAVVELEAGAQVRLIEEWTNNGQTEKFHDKSPTLHSSFQEFRIGKNAKLDLTQIINWKNSTQSFGRHVFNLAEGSELHLTQVFLSSSSTHWRSRCVLNGSHSEVNAHSFVHARKNQIWDCGVDVVHTVPYTSSHVEHSSLALGGSSVFNGTIRIEKKAIKTRASQKNRHLLLMPSQVTAAMPKLEILTDDVQCSHGTSTSQIDPEHLFYLQSRGLSLSEAHRMIMEAFATVVLDRIPSVSLKEHLKIQMVEYSV